MRYVGRFELPLESALLQVMLCLPGSHVTLLLHSFARLCVCVSVCSDMMTPHALSPLNVHTTPNLCN